MAGYLFNLSDLESLNRITQSGAYSTILNPSTRGAPYWAHHHESTAGDYVTMKTGDNVYFFLDRKIFGIGQLVKIGSDCKYLNFPGAGTSFIPDYSAIRDKLLLDSGEDSHKQRFVCFFEPSPFFFRTGVDMDDVLASNPPAFRNLRAMWKRSFIKFDDEENQAFRNIILKRNRDFIEYSEEPTNIYQFDETIHKSVSSKDLSKYSVNSGIQDILITKAEETHLKHEMAVELGLLNQLSIEDKNTTDTFGKWDYLTHQVIASPFKPIDYMDRMDIFGYSFLPNYLPTIDKYLVIEVKRDEGTTENIDQFPLLYQ